METRNKFLQSLSRKPKDIPPWVGVMMFLSNSTAQMGVIFMLLGIVSSYFVYTQLVAPNMTNIDDNDPIAQGVVTRVLPTTMSVNESAICKYFYEFKTSEGEIIKTSSENIEDIAEKGDEVAIQYNPDNPKESRFADVEKMDYDWALGVELIFLIIGLIFVIIQIVKIRKKVAIMKNGQIVPGTFVGKEATDVSVNENTVYRMFFKFTANGKEYKINVKTHRTYSLQDDEQELIMYDVRNPEKAFPIDVLPKIVKRFLVKT